jgi:stress response protein SCP2
MGVNLTKGANVNLTKAAPGLNKVIIGLGWDARASDEKLYDLIFNEIPEGVSAMKKLRLIT